MHSDVFTAHKCAQLTPYPREITEQAWIERKHHEER